MLVLSAMVPVALVAAGISLASAPQDLSSAPAWFGGAMVMALALIFELMWFVFASACALAVVRDSANGADEIENWPGGAFTDWIGDPLYIFIASCVSALPGAGLDWLLAHFGLPSGVAAPAGVFLLFPVVLLSMLEAESPLGAASSAVWRTFAVAANGWAGFYLAAATLVAVTAAVTASASILIGGLFGEFVASMALVAAWLIYFRLLGRLGWYCADRTSRAARKAEAEAEMEAEADDV
jgi:hypothetical protein